MLKNDYEPSHAPESWAARFFNGALFAATEVGRDVHKSQFQDCKQTEQS